MINIMRAMINDYHGKMGRPPSYIVMDVRTFSMVLHELGRLTNYKQRKKEYTLMGCKIVLVPTIEKTMVVGTDPVHYEIMVQYRNLLLERER